jgi:hypothetical protein
MLGEEQTKFTGSQVIANQHATQGVRSLTHRNSFLISDPAIVLVIETFWLLLNKQQQVN